MTGATNTAAQRKIRDAKVTNDRAPDGPMNGGKEKYAGNGSRCRFSLALLVSSSFWLFFVAQTYMRLPLIVILQSTECTATWLCAYTLQGNSFFFIFFFCACEYSHTSCYVLGLCHVVCTVAETRHYCTRLRTYERPRSRWSSSLSDWDKKVEFHDLDIRTCGCDRFTG